MVRKKISELARTEEERALALHREALVVDSLVASSMLQGKYFDRVREGGIDAVAVTSAMPELDHFSDAIKKMDAMYQMIAEHQHKMALATSVADIRQAKAQGKVAIILLFQDPMPIENDLAKLRTFYRLGLRVMQITYTQGGLLGSGCGELAGGGLTYFGREVVDEMNRLGMLVDLSHVGDQTTMDAIQYSKAPVVCTHSNARALHDSKRNKTDEQIKAMAAKGGVLGIAMLPFFFGKMRDATIEDFLDHIDYIANLVGIDHVGLGLDSVEVFTEEPDSHPEFHRLSPVWHARRPDIFLPSPPEGGEWPSPKGLETVAKAPNITKGLVARGYSDEEILKVLGGNWLRVYEEVWRE